jgi:hypothetical protein
MELLYWKSILSRTLPDYPCATSAEVLSDLFVPVNHNVALPQHALEFISKWYYLGIVRCTKSPELFMQRSNRITSSI